MKLTFCETRPFTAHRGVLTGLSPQIRRNLPAAKTWSNLVQPAMFKLVQEIFWSFRPSNIAIGSSASISRGLWMSVSDASLKYGSVQ